MIFRPCTLVLLVHILGLAMTSDSDMIAHPQEHASCNKALCASIVSYCMIQEKCGCDPAQNCSCCPECAVCLGEYYSHCCDCVGMRRGTNYTTSALPTVLSTISLIEEPEPELFRSLTENPTPALRFTILRFPIIEELRAHRRHHHPSNDNRHNSQQSDAYWNDVQTVLQRDYDGSSRGLCTAAYFDQCMPLKKCIWSCEKMGATSYRWFHNGCCECVGDTCFNYGHAFPKCSECMS